MNKPRTYFTGLLIGDVLAVLVVTIIGFVSHYGEIRGWRWLTSFLPILVGWFADAPWLGVYHVEKSRQTSQIWRAGLAALISAPLAATLRRLWLNSAIAPIFVLVLSATNALGFLVWRFLWTMLVSRASSQKNLVAK